MISCYELYESGDVFFDFLDELKKMHLENTKNNLIERIRGIMTLEHDIRNILRCKVSDSLPKACESYGSKIYKDVDKEYFSNRYSVNKIDTLCEFLDPTSKTKKDGWDMTPAAYNVNISLWREKDSYDCNYFLIRIDSTNCIIINSIEELMKRYSIFTKDEYDYNNAPDIELTIYPKFCIKTEDITEKDIDNQDRIERLLYVDSVAANIEKEKKATGHASFVDISEYIEIYNLKDLIDNMSSKEIFNENL